MSEKIEALIRTVKPLIAGVALAAVIYGLIQIFTPMQLVLGVSAIVAVYMLILVYEMNLDTVRGERSRREQNPII